MEEPLADWQGCFWVLKSLMIHPGVVKLRHSLQAM